MNEKTQIFIAAAFICSLAPGKAELPVTGEILPEVLPLLAELRGNGDALSEIHGSRTMEECVELALEINRKRPASHDGTHVQINFQESLYKERV